MALVLSKVIKTVKTFAYLGYKQVKHLKMGLKDIASCRAMKCSII